MLFAQNKQCTGHIFGFIFIFNELCVIMYKSLGCSVSSGRNNSKGYKYTGMGLSDEEHKS